MEIKGNTETWLGFKAWRQANRSRAVNESKGRLRCRTRGCKASGLGQNYQVMDGRDPRASVSTHDPLHSPEQQTPTNHHTPRVSHPNN